MNDAPLTSRANMPDEIDRIMSRAMDADMRKQMDGSAKGGSIYMTSMAQAAREALTAAGFEIVPSTEFTGDSRSDR